MTRYDEGPRWIRHRPDRAQRRASLALAVGAGAAVGAAVLYLSRLFMAREPLARTPAPESPASHGSARPARAAEGGGA